MRNPISYLICATERTGSHLLGDALALTGIAGRPRECFHPARFQELPTEPDPAAYAAYLDQVARECTTPNGVFGATVQWWQLKQLVLKLRELPGYRGIGAGELLQSWLPDARYVRLTRRDKVRQAVSHLKAIQTNAWWEMDAWARTRETAERAQPAFDADKIERLLRRIRGHEAVWQLLFEERGVQPLEIVYEDFVEAQAATTRRAIAELQIPVPPDLVIAPPRYRKQADGTSEEWVRRFHELRGTHAAHARGTAPMAPIEIPQEEREVISSHRPAWAITPGPLIQPRADPERALRIVVYSTQRLEGLPALLARCISQETVHQAHCVGSTPTPGMPCEEGTLDWRSDPESAAAALAAADVVLIHDGEVAPRHRARLADKALVILAHHPHAQHSPWLGLGFPGVLLDPLLAGLPAFQGWPHLALPWDSPHDWDRFWMPIIVRALPPSDPHGSVVHRSPVASILDDYERALESLAESEGLQGVFERLAGLPSPGGRE
ncbi:MAG TPA: Stf0 family sulfotransferase [Thermoanaerobaculia bacterium]